jgi:hypothetical protein
VHQHNVHVLFPGSTCCKKDCEWVSKKKSTTRPMRLNEAGPWEIP